jgi:hypothetical protein
MEYPALSPDPAGERNSRLAKSSRDRLRGTVSPQRYLSPDERRRAERFHFERHRNRFTIARGAYAEFWPIIWMNGPKTSFSNTVSRETPRWLAPSPEEDCASISLALR